MGVTGENNTRVALDPLMGFLSGPGGTIGGYNLPLPRCPPQTLGVLVALAPDQPTAITKKTTTGGSITSIRGALVRCNKSCRNIELQHNHELLAHGIGNEDKRQ